MISKYIYSIGWEAEGGICLEDYDMIAENPKFYGRVELGGDLSVDVRKSMNVRTDCYWKSNAEIKYWDYDFERFKEFVRTLFSLSFRQNSTCGNHFHLKFKSLLYASLFSQYEAQKMFIDKYVSTYKDQKKYMARLNNNYSKAPEDISDIIKNFYGPREFRYYAINFQSFFSHSYETLEFRIMPYAKDADELISQATFIITTVEEIISKFYKRSIKIDLNLNKVMRSVFREVK